MAGRRARVTESAIGVDDRRAGDGGRRDAAGGGVGACGLFAIEGGLKAGDICDSCAGLQSRVGFGALLGGGVVRRGRSRCRAEGRFVRKVVVARHACTERGDGLLCAERGHPLFVR